MDFEQAKQAFELYLNGYDRKDEKVYLKSGVCVPSSEKKHKELKQLYLKWRGKSRWELS